MTIWAIANQKGGVGKTTTVVSLAGLLAQQGKPTLMLDMDPHGSLTTYFGHDPDTIEKTVFIPYFNKVIAVPMRRYLIHYKKQILITFTYSPVRQLWQRLIANWVRRGERLGYQV
ncbi:MAG: AAA family ATPase [Gammaproteobacteria bacterium]|nr:AAA family ATPase [Gammaproteobacteria bacterium]